MTDVSHMLVGSLSNDLFWVASLAQRGSDKAASKFLQEAKRWSQGLHNQQVSGYIPQIALDISNRSSDTISLASAERYLMCGVLLQNYAYAP